MDIWGRLSRKARPGDTVRVMRASHGAPTSKVSAAALQDVVVAVRGINPPQLPSAIDGSAAVRDVLVGLGLAAACVPVRLHVANRRFRELFRQGRVPDEEESQRALGAILARTSLEDTSDTWGGHLVTIVDDYWLVDATLDFINDVEPTFRLAPIVSDSGRELIDGFRASLEFDGNLIVYERDDENQRYLKTPAWSDAKARKERHFSVLASIDLMKSSEAYRLLHDRIAAVAAAKKKGRTEE